MLKPEQKQLAGSIKVNEGRLSQASTILKHRPDLVGDVIADRLPPSGAATVALHAFPVRITALVEAETGGLIGRALPATGAAVILVRRGAAPVTAGTGAAVGATLAAGARIVRLVHTGPCADPVLRPIALAHAALAPKAGRTGQPAIAAIGGIGVDIDTALRTVGQAVSTDADGGATPASGWRRKFETFLASPALSATGAAVGGIGEDIDAGAVTILPLLWAAHAPNAALPERTEAVTFAAIVRIGVEVHTFARAPDLGPAAVPAMRAGAPRGVALDGEQERPQAATHQLQQRAPRMGAAERTGRRIEPILTACAGRGCAGHEQDLPQAG